VLKIALELLLKLLRPLIHLQLELLFELVYLLVVSLLDLANNFLLYLAPQTILHELWKGLVELSLNSLREFLS
jgi:hypothetical protein